MKDKMPYKKYDYQDNKLTIELSSNQKINLIPNNVSYYNIGKNQREFKWLLSLSNLRVDYEIIYGKAELLFLFPPNQHIKIFHLKNEDILLNNINDLLFWSDDLKIETHQNIGFLKHKYFITKISGPGFFAIKYLCSLEKIIVRKHLTRHIYIDPLNLILYDKNLVLKKVTVGKSISSYWKKKLLKVEGNGKMYLSPNLNFYEEIKLDDNGSIFEEMPFIGKPVSIFNKLKK
ncbi:MAG: AIM24 family protein [Candidatus Muiribacteriota bacterium]